ncbi:MAG: efflux RND transporter periplasmic adaptor subunit [Alphaproteobacteria bacterium]|nr:efflux RND transporter periplasmic adaptor subunit [Alphaproteobacteria bacterium]
MTGAAGYWLGQERRLAGQWTKYITTQAAAALGQAGSDASPSTEPPAASSNKRILYYRNPMGLADTSPTPKKDWMGMDYIPVYEGEEQEDGSTVKVGLERVQRSGVRTGRVERRVLTMPVRVPGTVKLDERRIKSVTLRFDGFIEDLFVNATGQAVKAGQPLFRVYSSQVQQAQVDLIVATREFKARGGAGGDADPMIQGPMQRLRNLDLPEARIREVRQTGANPRTIDWPSPMAGIVLEKKVIDGQRAAMGSELYRIADLGTVWVIAEVPEQELPQVRIGDRAKAVFLALPGEEREGKVTFVYPDLKPETRTARVRIELANPDLKLKTDMFAHVTIGAGGSGAAVIAAPDSAVIDSGTRQVVLVARGEGRFEPRAVRIGRRGEGMVEIVEGLAEGEEVVTSATFLIDAESNLKAALQAFTPPPPAAAGEQQP